MHMNPFSYEAYRDEYAEKGLQGVYQQLQRKRTTYVDYHLQDVLLYNMGNICVPNKERVQLMRESHTSKVVGHFGVGNTMANLHRYVYLAQDARRSS
jgi:hypothetical protein